MRLSFLPALLLAPPILELHRRAAAAAAPTAPDDTLCGTEADGHNLPARKGRLAAVAAAKAVGVSRPRVPCAAVVAAIIAVSVAALLAAIRSLLRAALASAISTLCLHACKANVRRWAWPIAARIQEGYIRTGSEQKITADLMLIAERHGRAGPCWASTYPLSPVQLQACSQQVLALTPQSVLSRRQGSTLRHKVADEV
jgi:hypothetical protein